VKDSGTGAGRLALSLSVAPSRAGVESLFTKRSP
jgi:hypothetical protein